MFQTLSFTFAQSPESNDHEVRPLVDGVDILEKAPGGPYLGIDPPEFFRQTQIINGGDLIIGRCGCGIVGCGDRIATVEFNDELAYWNISTSLRYEFDRALYLKTVENFSTNTQWESIERTAERLVRGLDFSSRTENGYAFEWASARIKRGQITLAFLVGDTQRLFDIGWDHENPEDAAKQVRRWLQANA